LREAARCFHSGGILAYPTEAVYGLGCDPMDWFAVERILEIKRRPVEKGLILIAADFRQLQPFVAPLSDEELQIPFDTWPGPTTWLLPAADHTPPWLRGEHETLAVRVTGHPIAAALSRACGSALVSTSANVSDRPPARTSLQTRIRLGRHVDYIVGGSVGRQSRPTTIRDLTSGKTVRA
jgi:L-threonylcarbamoyladenylate synthase